MPAIESFLSAPSANPIRLLPSLSAAEWEERLSRWELPASTTEEAIIERAARMVREAVDANAWLVSEGVTVSAQGSYFNNTNVRQEADMDLRVTHPNLVIIQDTSILGIDNVRQQQGYVFSSRTNGELAILLRTNVHNALAVRFGASNITPGKKAFRISAIPGSRSDIDIVPAMRFHYITAREPSTPFAPPDLGPLEGIFIFGSDGSETINFPQQHHRFGKSKRERTAYRFKKIVRMIKSLRDELVSAEVIAPKELPSFLIESLVYSVEDAHFMYTESRHSRLIRILTRVSQLCSNESWVANAREINGIKMLFSPLQPWNIMDVRACIFLALQRLGA